MSAYNRTLNYFRDAVEEELGVLDEFVSPGFVQRSLNEGQRRAAPRLLLPKVVYVTIDRGVDHYVLPDDVYDLTRFVADDGTYDIQPYQRHGDRLVFDCLTRTAFSGRLLYRSYFPDITNVQRCLLPEGALDALISFALAKCIRKVANDRSNYRKFSTLTSNGVSMQDLEDTAFQHLKEYDAAIDEAATLPPPLAYFES